MSDWLGKLAPEPSLAGRPKVWFRYDDLPIELIILLPERPATGKASIRGILGPSTKIYLCDRCLATPLTLLSRILKHDIRYRGPFSGERLRPNFNKD
jgi:hypothetical protein